MSEPSSRGHGRRATLLAALALALAACSGGGGSGPSGSATPTGSTSTAPSTPVVGPPAGPAVPGAVKVGWVPSLSAAPLLVGLREGLFAQELGAGVTVLPVRYDNGTAAAQALTDGTVPLTVADPIGTVLADIGSNGIVTRVLAGSGAEAGGLVVKPTITSAAALKGARLAVSGAGMEVALRSFMQQQGFDKSQFTVTGPTSDAAVRSFAAGELDGAWLPEPYASELVAKGGKRLAGTGPAVESAHLVADTKAMGQQEAEILGVLRGWIAALDLITADPARAQAAYRAELKAQTGQDVDPAVLATAWKQVSFGVDPLPATLDAAVQQAVDLKALDPQAYDSVGGSSSLYDFSLVNRVLGEAGRPQLKQP